MIYFAHSPHPSFRKNNITSFKVEKCAQLFNNLYFIIPNFQKRINVYLRSLAIKKIQKF